MPHRILHLSDTHMTAGRRDEDGVDAMAALDQILHDTRHVTDLDLVLVSGDIADDGSVEGSLLVRDRIAQFAAARGVPHVYTTGNHDTRAAFHEVFGTGHLDANGDDIGVPFAEVADGRAAVSVINGLRVVTLDSLVPGSVHGVVSATQLRGLREVLAQPAPAGTVLALHHPPIASAVVPWTDVIGLRNADQLAEAIAGSDVIVILCGHFHSQLTGRLGAATVWVTPGVVTRMDLTAPGHVMRAVHGASATVVQLGGVGSPMFHVLHARDSRANEQVYVVDPETWAEAEEEPPVKRGR